MTIKPLLLCIVIFNQLIVIPLAHAEIQAYDVQKHQLATLNFPASFPQLYFFNSKGELFYLTGGGRGDAVGDLTVFATNLDKAKVKRMSQRPAIAVAPTWKEKFSQLASQVTPTPHSPLISDKVQVTLIGLILDRQDYPGCTPCKQLADKMQALSVQEGLSLILISQKRP